MYGLSLVAGPLPEILIAFGAYLLQWQNIRVMSLANNDVSNSSEG